MAMSACQQGGRTLFFDREGENELKSVQCKSAANLMRKEFGERICDTCGECCNRQYKSKVDKVMICIAFDDETKWDRNEKACGLFNIPFRGIRPKRMPYGEFLRKNTKARTDTTNLVDQGSLFSATV